MSNDIKLTKNNDFFFDSIMSMRYLRPKLIDNEFLNKIKKQYQPIKVIEVKPEVNDKLFVLEKKDSLLEKTYNKCCDFCYNNIRIIIIIILLILFLYYRYQIFRRRSNDELIIDNIYRENKKKELINKKLFLEKLLKNSNIETNINNNIIHENNINIQKNINDNYNNILTINETNNNINNDTIDNYLKNSNLMAHNDIYNNYDYI